MGIAELLLISVSLAMDAFAVAICKGACMRRRQVGQSLLIAASFGIFQALMPLIGWFLGIQLQSYIAAVDHWIAFLLLAAIGGKMIWDALREPEGAACECKPLRAGELLLLSLATSIDALAVGIAFAMLQADIYLSVAVIGVITFIISLCGVLIGNRVGQRFQQRAQIAGGVVLCLIGARILLEHLGLL